MVQLLEILMFTCVPPLLSGLIFAHPKYNLTRWWRETLAYWGSAFLYCVEFAIYLFAPGDKVHNERVLEMRAGLPLWLVLFLLLSTFAILVCRGVQWSRR